MGKLSWNRLGLSSSGRGLPRLARCGLGALGGMTPLVLRLPAAGAMADWAYGVAFVAVVTATMLFGLPAGLCAAVTGWTATIIWFVEPVGTFKVDDWQDLAAAIFLPACSLFVAVLAEVFRTVGSTKPDRG